MTKITSAKDLLILLLYARGSTGRKCEPIKDKTRLMKMIFLFDKEIKKEFNKKKKVTEINLPNFRPYDYGPFSDEVYVDLEFLVDMGFVRVKRLNDETAGEEEFAEYEYWQASSGSNEITMLEDREMFELTLMGRNFLEDGKLGKISDNEWEILNKFKSRCVGISLKALLRYVYAKYPKMTTKSKIKKQVMR